MTPEEQAAADKAARTAEFKSLIEAALKPVTESLTALTGNQKVLADTLAADRQAASDAGGKGEKKPTTAPTLDDVSKLLDTKLQAFTQSQQVTAARQAYVGEKMKDVPTAYLVTLGNDPQKFAEQEQAIRTQLKADLGTLGVKAADVVGDAAGKPVTAAVDTSKLSPTQLIERGLSQSRPIGAGVAGGAGATAATGAEAATAAAK